MAVPTLNYVSCPDRSGSHRMAYWQWGDESAPHAVVCAHGLSRQGRDFDVLAQALLQRAGAPLRVICPDVVGRGRSDWLADPMGYQLPTYVADMLQLLQQQHARAPLETLDWVGTSMGGLIGMALAGTPQLPLPVPIRRLVLNDVGPVIQWAAIERFKTYIGKAGTFESVQAAADAMWAVSTGFGPHSPEQWLALSQPMVKPVEGGGYALHYDPAIGVPVQATTREAAAQAEATLWQVYDAVKAQTLLLRGAESDLLTAQAAREMTERGPRARLVEFAGVGHAPTLIAPDQLDAVVTFVLGTAPA